ncbi:hypothetical protein GCM10023178_39840 [Actinomadura luteofluorescens]
MRGERRGARWGAITVSSALAAPLTLMSPAAQAVPETAPPNVRLRVATKPDGVTLQGSDYTLAFTVRVSAQGGVARKAGLRLTADRPLSWTSRTPDCSPLGSGQGLRCVLGDVGPEGRERRGTVRFPASLVQGPSAKPLSILAVADASNAPRRSTRTFLDFTKTARTALNGASPNPSSVGQSGDEFTPCTNDKASPATQWCPTAPLPGATKETQCKKSNTSPPTRPCTPPSGSDPAYAAKPQPGTPSQCAVAASDKGSRPCTSPSGSDPAQAKPGSSAKPSAGGGPSQCAGATSGGGGPCVSPSGGEAVHAAKPRSVMGPGAGGGPLQCAGGASGGGGPCVSPSGGEPVHAAKPRASVQPSAGGTVAHCVAGDFGGSGRPCASPSGGKATHGAKSSPSSQLSGPCVRGNAGGGGRACPSPSRWNPTPGVTSSGSSPGAGSAPPQCVGGGSGGSGRPCVSSSHGVKPGGSVYAVRGKQYDRGGVAVSGDNPWKDAPRCGAVRQR